MPNYIAKHPELPRFLECLRKSGKKVFLLTNSEYQYTEAVMEYLLSSNSRIGFGKWTDYFDIIITSSQKPKFFVKGSTFREVDTQRRLLKVGPVLPSEFEKGIIYSGGSFNVFKEFTKTNGSEVLFVGDNIFHDVVVSKKKRCLWRTCLIWRELKQDLEIVKQNFPLYTQLQNLEYLRARSFQGLSAESMNKVERSEILEGVSAIREKIDEITLRMDSNFNKFFGSIVRTGSAETFFSNQTKQFADLYTSQVINFSGYPMYYFFYPTIFSTLPHAAETIRSCVQANLQLASSSGGSSANAIVANATAAPSTITPATAIVSAIPPVAVAAATAKL